MKFIHIIYPQISKNSIPMKILMTEIEDMGQSPNQRVDHMFLSIHLISEYYRQLYINQE